MIHSAEDSFHVTTGILRDLDLVGVRKLLTQSRRSALQLTRDFENWRESANQHIDATLDSITRRRVTYKLHVDRIIPHDHWALTVGRIVHGARSALDQLNTTVFRRFADDRFNERRISFPIAISEHEWNRWGQKHRALPSWMMTRYLAVQPFQQPYQGLIGLRELDDADKHRELTPISVALLGQFAAATFTVKDDIDGAELDPQIEAASNILRPGTRSAVIGTIAVSREIESFTSDDVDEAVDFEPMFFFGSEHYTLKELVELPVRVASAVEYVAQNNQNEFSNYVARPAWLATDVEDDS